MNIMKADSVLINRHVHPYKLIERIGRTCYKSEDVINDDSAVKFVRAMAKNKHYAMLEHGQIYLKLNACLENILEQLGNEALKYIAIVDCGSDKNGKWYIVGGSFRAFKELVYFHSDNFAVNAIGKRLENVYPEVFDGEVSENTEKVFGDVNDKPEYISVIEEAEVMSTINNLQDITKEQKDEYLRSLIVHTVRFFCDRGVSHEFVRHRPASFAQESTRYCNYSKDKFGNEITVIEPCFWTIPEKAELLAVWADAVQYVEKAYFKLLELGATPQETRSVLPNSLKTELCITATEAEWQHIMDLRYHGVTGAPHPQMVESMTIIAPVLIEASQGRLH